jgi:transcriptional regulator with XRE-family HTH domain
MKKIVEALLAYQKSKNLSQTQMAEQLGISQASYNCWINGKHSIGSKHLLKISTLCGIPFEELIPKDVTLHIQHDGQEAYSESINALALYKQIAHNAIALNQSLQERVAFLEGRLGLTSRKF